MTKKRLFYIIASGLIIFGTVLFLIGFSLKGMNAENWMKKLEIKDNYYNIEDSFTSVSSNICMGDFKIIQSKGKECTLEGRNIPKKALKVYVEDKTLNIELSLDKPKYWYYHISFFNSIKSPEFTLSLPKTVYDDVTIDLNLGKLSIENMNAKNITATCDCGDIKITGTASDYLEIDEDLGEVDLDNVSVKNKCNIESSCGNIKIKNSYMYGNGLYMANLGDFDITESTITNGDWDIDCGDLSIKKSYLYGRNEIDIDLGSSDISLYGKAEDYSIVTDIDVGDVKIDGVKGVHYNPGAKNSLEINLDCGDVDINFEGE